MQMGLQCKLGANGEVTAFKARLVAKGYTQLPGVDFEETYSPVAMAKSIRILLAIAAWYDYEIWQIDIKMIFLNGYVERRSLWIDRRVSLLLEKNKKSIVSKDPSMTSSRSWNTRFNEVMRGYDFIKNEHDPCVYKKVNGSSVAYLVLYVDDIIHWK
ncbi:UNVERIFIED_CONTAM: hypothetical protein Sradi_4120200 [Sesamum radiatum]|uniref:Reverse transcriptase Ty1/copia-type domain-containing protein n=1 Tax=Sesamum radiatum TaxID=300843 RepID=A0AAW2P0S0_SESRA